MPGQAVVDDIVADVVRGPMRQWIDLDAIFILDLKKVQTRALAALMALPVTPSNLASVLFTATPGPVTSPPVLSRLWLPNHRLAVLSIQMVA